MASQENELDFQNHNDMLVKESKLKKSVILDVGGERFNTFRTTLERYPTTRLGKLMRASSIKEVLDLCDESIPGETPEYFFDKNPDNFLVILDMYRTKKFHLFHNGCALVLQRNLEYWNIDEMTIESCCALKYYPEVDVAQNEKDGDLEAKKIAMERAEEENFGSSKIGVWRSWVWNTIEYPWTSSLAQAWAFLSLSAVVLSTITFIISTADELQENAEGVVEFPNVVVVIDMIDNFVVFFFFIEFVIRFIICPKKMKFLKDPMNIIDILAIIPFFLSLLLEGLEDFEIIGKTGKIIRLVRIMRILRIFKLVRHFAGLQSIFHTLQQAYQELGLLLVLVAVAILTYSSLVYFAEREVPVIAGLNCTNWEQEYTREKWNNIGSHPCYTWTFVESFWWGLMTITTVGYDLNPKTLLGKFIAGFCALSGVFILTLPIPIVVNSFAR